VFVETAGGRVVAQDPYDHVRQLHLPQRSGRGTHKLAAVALALCAVEDIDRVELARKSGLARALASARGKADDPFIRRSKRLTSTLPVDHKHAPQPIAYDPSPAVRVRLPGQRDQEVIPRPPPTVRPPPRHIHT